MRLNVPDGAARQLRGRRQQSIKFTVFKQFRGQPLSIGFHIIAVTNRRLLQRDAGTRHPGGQLRNDRRILHARQPAEAAASLRLQATDDSAGGLFVVARDIVQRLIRGEVRHRRQKNTRLRQLHQLLPVPFRPVRAPDQQPVHETGTEHRLVPVPGFVFRAVEEQQQIVAGGAQHLLDPA